LVPYDKSDVGDAQRLVFQELLRIGDPLPGQPYMRRTPGRHAEGRAKMEAAQIDQIGQFLDADILRRIFPHIGGDALDLPARQPGGPDEIGIEVAEWALRS
jgi:hypothetical protein